MKSSTINTTLGLIALATMSFAASNAQADHDIPQRFNTPYGQVTSNGQNWNERGNYNSRHGQRANQQRIAEINSRQAQQQNRIEQGSQNGTLTRREFRVLMSQQQRIRSMKRNFISDGFISPFEFQRLDNALDTADRNIRSEKHDRESRNSYDEHARNDHRWGNYR